MLRELLVKNIVLIESLNINFTSQNENIEFYSFVDQYICCKSSKFYYINLESTRINMIHNRSTFTSFILDYRNFLLKNGNNYNLM